MIDLKLIVKFKIYLNIISGIYAFPTYLMDILLSYQP